MAQVYIHRRKDNLEVFYIGMSTSTYGRAFIKHRNLRSKEWLDIDKKYGTIIEIISDNISDEDAIELEISLIKKHGRKDLGLGNLVNKTDGGMGTLGSLWLKGIPKSETHKKNIGKANKGKTISSDELERLRKLRLGMIPWNKDKKNCFSEETKKKMSVSAKKTWETRKQNNLKNKKQSE